MFGENNCIKYGKGANAIKCEEHVYISSTKSKGQSLRTSSLYERELIVEHTKKTFYPSNNKHAHQHSIGVSFYSFNNNKIWIVREPRSRADEIVIKHLYFAGSTRYFIRGFGNGVWQCISASQATEMFLSFHLPTPLSGIYFKELI